VRALVTGGAGFIGSILIDRLLAEGHEVDAIDDLSSGSLANLAEARTDRARRFTFHRMDIRSPATADYIVQRRPEVVFHLAGQSDPRVSMTKPAMDAEVNVIGSLHVLQGASSAGSRKVIFTSSGGAIYGPVDELPTKELHAQRPILPSGIAKKVVADYLHFYREVHGLDYTNLVLGHVYGPRQNPAAETGVVARFAGRMIARERPTIYGDGRQTRDLVFVDDIVDALVRSVDRAPGLMINIGTGRETSVQELYDVLARLLQYKEPARHSPARPGDIGRSALDSSRAEIHLGWTAYTSLESGLRQTIDWFRNTGAARARRM
jgi:UDP-glucose 4-epimerase